MEAARSQTPSDVKHERMDLDAPTPAPPVVSNPPQYPPSASTNGASTTHTPAQSIYPRPPMATNYGLSSRPPTLASTPTPVGYGSMGTPTHSQRPSSNFASMPVVNLNPFAGMNHWNAVRTPINTSTIHSASPPVPSTTKAQAFPTPPSSNPSRGHEADKPKPPLSNSPSPHQSLAHTQPTPVGGTTPATPMTMESFVEAERQREREMARQRELERQKERDRQLQDMRNRAAKIVDTINPRREGLSGSNAL